MSFQDRKSLPEHRPLARALKAGGKCFAQVYHRLTVHSPPRLPRTGPAILVGNHVSSLDPVLIQSVCPRLVTWVMAKEYYNVRGLGWVFKAIGTIGVERSGRDLSSTRAAMRALADGSILGIFPEGKIETNRAILPFHDGVALMAIKMKVPVFPVYLDGTQRGREMVDAVLRPCTASIAFGREVEIDRSSTSKGTLETETEKIRNAVRDLRDKYDMADL